MSSLNTHEIIGFPIVLEKKEYGKPNLRIELKLQHIFFRLWKKGCNEASGP